MRTILVLQNKYKSNTIIIQIHQQIKHTETPFQLINHITQKYSKDIEHTYKNETYHSTDNFAE